MRFIGDVHGHIDEYIALAGQVDESIQVGDMGVGFPGVRSRKRDEKLAEFQLTGDHRFIRGNHDNPYECGIKPGYIYDGFVDQERGMMFIGGAFSIDLGVRTVGYDMWSDEELSYTRLTELTALYEHVKPRIVVTHDCPESVATDMFFADGNMWGPQIRTRTGAALQAMFEIHQPELWVFGHWHVSKAYRRPDTPTTFICLGELAYCDIQI